MIKPPSIQKEYTLIFSGDPALDLPEVSKIADDATAEVKEAAKKAATERARILQVARETGNWPIKPGGEPTLFHFVPLSGQAQTHLFGEMTRRKLTDPEVYELAFRLALRRVDNFGSLKVAFDTDGEFPLVASDFVNTVYDIGYEAGEPDLGRRIVGEFGSHVFFRARTPLSPKP